MVLDIKPLPRSSGFCFEEKITGGVVPRNYIPSVEEGVIDGLKHGPLGFPVVDVAVTLIDGSYHTVDSSDMAFRTAGRIGIVEALPQCQPVLLEPIHAVEIMCPSEATAKMNAILSGRRGQILGFDTREGWEGWDVVRACCRKSEIGNLIIEVRSATAGVGRFTSSSTTWRNCPAAPPTRSSPRARRRSSVSASADWLERAAPDRASLHAPFPATRWPCRHPRLPATVTCPFGRGRTRMARIGRPEGSAMNVIHRRGWDIPEHLGHARACCSSIAAASSPASGAAALSLSPELALAQRIADLPDPTAGLYPVKRNEAFKLDRPHHRRKAQRRATTISTSSARRRRSRRAAQDAADPALDGEDRRHGGKAAGRSASTT